MAALSLKYRERAELLQQWAQMESAGLPPTIMAQTLLAGARPPWRPALKVFEKNLSSGQTPDLAGRRAGLLHQWEASVIKAAFESGRLQAGLHWLADEFNKRAMRLRAFTSRMALPVLILLLGSFISPLPALFSGALSMGGYLWQALWPVALLAGLFSGGFWLLQRDYSVSASLSNLLLRLPVIGSLLALRARRDYLKVLVMALRSGIAAIAATDLAANSLGSRYVAAQFGRATGLIKDGVSVAEALRSVNVLSDPSAYALAHSGEQAGELDSMLERCADRYEQRADVLADAVAEWLPRLIYAALMAAMLLRIVGFWSTRMP